MRSLSPLLYLSPHTFLHAVVVSAVVSLLLLQLLLVLLVIPFLAWVALITSVVAVVLFLVTDLLGAEAAVGAVFPAAVAAGVVVAVVPFSVGGWLDVSVPSPPPLPTSRHGLPILQLGKPVTSRSCRDTPATCVPSHHTTSNMDDGFQQPKHNFLPANQHVGVNPETCAC